MGEAKRKREAGTTVVYHHTSTLRTNLLWMSGYVEVEGHGKPAFHPQLGRIEGDVRLRRQFRDFPPVAWFTSQLAIPRCLIVTDLQLADQETGEHRGTINVSESVAHGLALNRVALAFPTERFPVVRWADHPGYATNEGRVLNETARDYGDDPNDWWVSDTRVDLMEMCAVYVASSVTKPKLERRDGYLADVKKMVALCRQQPGVFIPPTWLSQDKAQHLAAAMGLPVVAS